MASLETAITQLENLYSIFNDHLFSSQLIKPVIIIQSNGRKKSVMGWCTTRKIWRDLTKDEAYYEISISAEYLDTGLLEICDTLIHEMVHLYNLQFEINDTSRSGIYHNKKFKKEAERAGLEVSFSKSHGWANTRLKSETKEFIKSLSIDEKAFALSREFLLSLEGGRGRQSTRRYICPECALIIRATKEVNVICGDCMKTMELEEE